MTQPKLITKPFADDALPGYVNEIPKENPVGAPEQNASWSEGFPPITMTDINDGGLPPNGEDMNGVLRAITEHNLFIGGGGVYDFSDDYITEVGGYSKGAVLVSDGKTALWMSIQDNNTQNFNGATKNQWRRIAFTELDSTLTSIQDALNTKADKSVTITAGDGLTGGGTLAGNRVLAVSSSVVRTGRTITAGTGLSGGGNLSDNRTLSVNYGTAAGTAAQGNDARITGAAQKSANLSDLSSAPAARQNLGLGTAATRNVGESGGNVMQVGAFGLGVDAGVDITTMTEDEFKNSPSQMAGIYLYDSSTSWLSQYDPNGFLANYLAVLRVKRDNNGSLILMGGSNNNLLYFPQHGRGALRDIVSIAHSGNLLQTTGQSTVYPMTQKAVTDAINNSAIGVGQTWQNVTGSRALGVNYTNTSGRAIYASVTVQEPIAGNAVSCWLYVNGAPVDYKTNSATSTAVASATAGAIVPAGAVYSGRGGENDELYRWAELR